MSVRNASDSTGEPRQRTIEARSRLDLVLGISPGFVTGSPLGWRWLSSAELPDANESTSDGRLAKLGGGWTGVGGWTIGDGGMMLG